MALKARATEQLEAKVKALGKLPENRACINCGSKGSQSVCTTFSTFVCIPCSGIHREFTHRIKSMSMSSWTQEEVRALQEGGNETARQIYFKDWDPSKFPVPDNSNAERLRSFIKAVYVDKRFTGELSVSNVRERRASDPRDATSPHSSTGYSPRYSPREADRYAGSGSGPGGERYTSKESPKDKPKKRGLFGRFSGGSPRTSDDRTSRTSSERGSRRGSEERSQSAEQSPRHELRGVRDMRSSYDEKDQRVDSFPVARTSLREERPQSPPIQPIEAVLGPDTPKLRLAGEPNYKDGPNSPGFLRGPPNKAGALGGANSTAAHRREKSAALIDFNFEDEPAAAAPSTTPADPFGAPAPAGDAGTGAWATFGDAPAFEAAGTSGGGFADANAGWNTAGSVGGGPPVQAFPGPGTSQGSGDWNTFSNQPPHQQSGWGFAPQPQPGLAPFPAHFGAFPAQQGFPNPGQCAPYPPQQGLFPHQNQLPPSGNFYPPAHLPAQGPPQAVAPTSQGPHANGMMAPQGPPSTSGPASTGGGISKIGALPDDLFSEKGGPPTASHVYQPPQHPAYVAPLQQYTPMPPMPGYAAPPKSRNPFEDPPPSGPGGGPPAQPFNFGPLSNALPSLGPPSFGLPGSQGAPAPKQDPFGGSGGFQQTDFGPQFPNNTGGSAPAGPSSHGALPATKFQGGTLGNPF